MRFCRLMTLAGALTIAGAVCALAAAPQAATPAACIALRKHGQRAEAQTCFQTLTRAADAYQRAEGLWGLERYDDANAEFRAAVAHADRTALYRVRWGRL